MMSENTPLSVYVTGATQGLGREVMRQLAARGHQVAGTASSLDDTHLIRAAGGLPVYNDPFRTAEVISTLKMIAADVVVNLAPQAVNSHTLQGIDWEREQHALADGTAALADAVRAGAARFLVHTSFTFLYGDAGGAAVDESAALDSANAFFQTAALAEQRALAAPGCVLRAGSVYGPENAATVALNTALIAGHALPLGDDDHLANWVHVHDLARAVALAVEQQPAGAVFNIADDHPAPVAAFAAALAASHNLTAPRRQRLPSLGRQIFMHPAHQAILDSSAHARIDRAQAALGWSPRYADYHAGLEQTLLAWRAAVAP
jgi:nucleoside-diphosphate-sugar epimerase